VATAPRFGSATRKDSGRGSEARSTRGSLVRSTPDRAPAAPRGHRRVPSAVSIGRGSYV